MSVKIEKSPRLNDTISVFDLDFKLNPMKMGNIGSMQGDSIEMTPVKKETTGNKSIYIPLI